MRIIVVDNSLDITGAFKAVLNNVLLDDTGNEYRFFIPKQSRNRALLESKGYTVYTFTSYELSRNPRNIVLYLPFLLWNGWRLARLAKRQQADLLYQNEVFILVGLVAKCFTRVKVLTHIRVMPTIFPKRLYRFWLWLHDRFADKVLCVSFACRDAALRCYVMRQPVEVLYDFVLPQRRHADFVVRQTPPYRVLFLGNYTRGKGQDLAVEAMRILRQKAPDLDVQLHLYGSDFGYAPNVAYRQELAAAVRLSGLEDRVLLHDFAEDVEAVMLAHDLLLNLSVAESFSFVVAEAMFFGLPVLATDSGGPGELIAHGRAGEIVPPDAAVIAERMLNLLQQPEIRAAYSHQQQSRITNLVQDFGGVGKLQETFRSLQRPFRKTSARVVASK